MSRVKKQESKICEVSFFFFSSRVGFWIREKDIAPRELDTRRTVGPLHVIFLTKG
jgi:hypothetical protein